MHYEKLGRGRPVLLLHSWIGSWRYWVPLMQHLRNTYTIYTIDLLGFGDSAKTPQFYSLDARVQMLDRFLDQLGIPKAAVIGHGLGGMVAVRFGLAYPTRIARLVLSSLPLFNPGDLEERVPAGTRRLLTRRDRYSLAPELDEDERSDDTIPNPPSNNDPGQSRVRPDDPTIHNTSGTQMAFHELPTAKNSPREIDREALRRAAEARERSQQNPLYEAFENVTIADLLRKAFKKSEDSFNKLKIDVDKADDAVLLASAEDYDAGEMLDDLRRLTMPIALLHGQADRVMPPPDDPILEYLTLEKEDFLLPFLLEDVRHFPMLEYEPFARLVEDFLSTTDFSKLEIRKRWRRRSI